MSVVPPALLSTLLASLSDVFIPQTLIHAVSPSDFNVMLFVAIVIWVKSYASSLCKEILAPLFNVPPSNDRKFSFIFFHKVVTPLLLKNFIPRLF